jgi:hypothetical protein
MLFQFFGIYDNDIGRIFELYEIQYFGGGFECSSEWEKDDCRLKNWALSYMLACVLARLGGGEALLQKRLIFSKNIRGPLFVEIFLILVH